MGHNSIDQKPGASAHEHTQPDKEPGINSEELALDAAAQGQGVSGFESLTWWETVKAFKVTVAICFAVTFSAATDGYQIGINGNIIANPGFVRQFATKFDAQGEPYLTSPILAGWSSIQSVGQIIGMIHLSFVSDRYGRKVAMYWYWLILACSVLAESLARRWEVWLVAKLLAGIGVGCLQSTIPTYVTEVAPVRIRGALLMCYSLWLAIGLFMAPVALEVLSHSDPNDFLTPIYTQWSQIGLMILVYLVIPESPVWCVSKGKHDQAKKALRYLNHGVKDYDVDQQLQLISLSLDHERTVAAEQRREKWYAIFQGIDGLRTLISLWTLMSQQFIGLTLFGTYASYFFQQTGISNPFKITCITSGINVAAGLVLVFTADRLGRRRLSCNGTTLSWLSTVVIGILGVVPKVHATSYIMVLFAVLWNVGIVANSATGWGFIGEISSQRLRPYTAGFAAASTCVAGIIMNVLTPYMVNSNQWNWGLKTGWFYAGVGLPFTVAMWFLIPETSNRSPAELDELFERKVRPWQFHKTKTVTQRIIEEEKNKGLL
ncbi:general substrate transporter [Ilyonectria sp. MPI-CAGE-AT-0026]|nr:general substrate transporter [Ilyonectria sp. MPI-CAGE-AT-0026]